jgi:hypothetical protein
MGNCRCREKRPAEPEPEQPIEHPLRRLSNKFKRGEKINSKELEGLAKLTAENDG